MSEGELPGWILVASTAAVRLAAEAGTEADDIIEHAGTGEGSHDRLARHAARFEANAELSEVAIDLAGLLWAEWEDVPPIATILEEPAARAALEAVAEARRLEARRLADGAAVASPATEPLVPPPAPSGVRRSIFGRGGGLDDGPASAGSGTRLAQVTDPPPEGAVLPALPPAPTKVSSTAPTPVPPITASERVRRRASSAVVAGAAATALLLYGRRLRRA